MRVYVRYDARRLCKLHSWMRVSSIEKRRSVDGSGFFHCRGGKLQCKQDLLPHSHSVFDLDTVTGLFLSHLHDRRTVIDAYT